MSKIQMKTPLVEIDGDEMTRVLWPIIKKKLIMPFVDLKTEYYDLGMKKRDETDDQITIDAANAIIKYGVGVKNATITPNEPRVKEYSLKKQWKSPNGTIRAILDGTVFRKPILVNNIKPSVSTWKKPIIVGRHAYGDIYKNAEIFAENGGKLEIRVTDKNGNVKSETIIDINETTIVQGVHNTISSIKSFARACFEYSLDQKVDCWFGTKDTISKTYDQTFKKTFEEIFETEYKEKFTAAGIEYFYTLIDDVVARIMKCDGGILWICKNYDGDVMSDMVASAFGSLAMMTSVLVSPKGYFEYEAAHGTVQKHYYKYLKGEKTSTNPVALIYAWTGALRKRGELDGIYELCSFADRLDKAVITVIESGVMTGDLAAICNPKAKQVVNSEDFIQAIATIL
ncbi:MAG: isocitrate dehydrogenase [Spirochaetes bacterium GWF1_31_7]|nr:MAG: isocitrate dehydrogenase [Spirochaetes bacterium GWE1_32_154]OHD50809.1 MAG: isocitrate dehydrogenase [Spirochaetes bacterium GWE2_31_10]OHD52746.1 MAG: isocitrate dehydrogenase [Spirochaetes bacterium GWF1_31_7]OHD78555.1 MAG: isocitrate dehydrogenase [Spirochaetes bacterium RIFOXYB1_FULL_32_8]HBD95422.1 NADP-dependent isocitrate dehydrogenase [Spirochaetia bacterium]